MLSLAACAGGGGQVELPDVSSGQYLDPEEVAQLPPAAQDRYCQLLEQRLDSLRIQRDELVRQTQLLRLRADSLRQQVLELNRTYRDLQTEVRQLKLKKKRATSYVVREGDTLTRISSLFYGTGARWQEIYEANKDILESPTTPLKPGTRLRIPQ
jgi:nucleoid-associated protein YgaU